MRGYDKIERGSLISRSAWVFRVELKGQVWDHVAELHEQVHGVGSVSLVFSHQSFDVIRLDVRARNGDFTLLEASIEDVVIPR